MRRPLVAGNWKMNLTIRESAALVTAFLKGLEIWDKADVVICPSYLSIPSVLSLLKESRVKVGAQDVFWKETGAFTGEVSPAMLKEAGVTYCIVGHSETRGRFGKLEIPESTTRYFSETDETVNLKLKGLLYCEIKPILCVGETLAEREAGNTDAIISSQLSAALDGLIDAELEPLVVAYEPVWAIGTGKTCDTAEAQRVCAMIRRELCCVAPELAQTTRILYGGSVKGSNARELFSQPDIDGGLVGGARLSAGEFKDIVMCAR
jgi:triosephosphate isomerase (TIM)